MQTINGYVVIERAQCVNDPKTDVILAKRFGPHPEYVTAKVAHNVKAPVEWLWGDYFSGPTAMMPAAESFVRRASGL